MSDRWSPEQSVETRSAIWRMFRDAADEDYLLARFSARANLQYQFWWNAQQAVEKYLKAILLLNGQAVKSFGHEIAPMFLMAVDICGDLLPALHCPPKEIQTRGLGSNPRGFLQVEKFVERLHSRGDSNNRYRAFSISTKPTDLLYFDELCFFLRRVAFPLEMNVEGFNKSARVILTENRGLQLHPKLVFENDIFAKKAGSTRIETFRWCNFAYFPQEAVDDGKYPNFGRAVNAAPFVAINRGADDTFGAMTWIANQAFPRKLRLVVIGAIDEAKRSRE